MTADQYGANCRLHPGAMFKPSQGCPTCAVGGAPYVLDENGFIPEARTSNERVCEIGGISEVEWLAILARDDKYASVQYCDVPIQDRRALIAVIKRLAGATAETSVAPDLDEFVEWVEQWAGAYPLDVFPEPDLEEARMALATVGITLDSVSAFSMRHVITRVHEKLRATLKTSAPNAFVDAHRCSSFDDGKCLECGALKAWIAP